MTLPNRSVGPDDPAPVTARPSHQDQFGRRRQPPSQDRRPGRRRDFDLFLDSTRATAYRKDPYASTAPAKNVTTGTTG
ncbi:hypothetical protein ACFVHW_07780 [Streptomyces sp. NPDC127110]|uniref:hypothetical protein n=1 Tax=Streptomyces sp. NPDC127110 TaxID=3345362 RepID=UPI0036309585